MSLLKTEFLSSIAGLGVPQDGSLDSAGIIQSSSGELKRGDKRFDPDARAGDFRLEGRKPVPGEKGFDCLVLHIKPAVVASPADGSLGTLAVYREAPEHSTWREETDENGKTKKVFRHLSTRQILTQTLFVTLAMIENGRVDFDQLHEMRITKGDAKRFSNTLSKALTKRSMLIKGEDGKLYVPPVFYVVTNFKTELTNKDQNSWYVSVATIGAKHGEPGGPTESDLQIARDIHEEREAFARVSYTPPPGDEGPPAPTPETAPIPAAKPTPALGTPEGNGSRFTTGVSGNSNPRPFAPIEREPEGPADYSDYIEREPEGPADYSDYDFS
jgi:hypothetical protein